MFTGIIEGLGVIREVGTAGGGRRLTVAADLDLSETKIGDSICVNGACLTVVRLWAGRFAADVSPETLSVTTLGEAAPGDRVNLERAMRLSGRLDGHLVSGHVDGRGVVTGRRPAGNAEILSIAADPSLARYMIPKGSVAVDGISLTINTLTGDGFSVAVIPHTAKMTTIGDKNPGAAVNIETDLIGKYVARFLAGSSSKRQSESGINLDLLAKSGFL